MAQGIDLPGFGKPGRSIPIYGIHPGIFPPLTGFGLLLYDVVTFPCFPSHSLCVSAWHAVSPLFRGYVDMRALLIALAVVLLSLLFFPRVLHTTAAAAFDAARPAQEAAAVVAFDLALTAQNAADVAGFEFDILYNRAAAQITGLTPRLFFGQAGSCNPSSLRCAAGLGPLHKNNGSRVGAYSYGALAGATGAGTLAIIRVQTSASPDSLTFTIANALVVDSQGNPIPNVTLQLARATNQLFLPMVDR